MRRDAHFIPSRRSASSAWRGRSSRIRPFRRNPLEARAGSSDSGNTSRRDAGTGTAPLPAVPTEKEIAMHRNACSLAAASLAVALAFVSPAHADATPPLTPR